MTIRVLAIDSHEITLLGVKSLLEKAGMQLAATAKTAAETKTWLIEAEFDVVLVEMLLDGADGLAVLKTIRSRNWNLPVLIFTASDEPIIRALASAWGARGCILKREQPDRLCDAIRRVVRGESAWSPEHLRQFHGRVTGDSSVHLTDREGEVLHLLALGMLNHEIARMLGIGYHTTRDHVKSILRKLKVERRMQAAVWATKRQMEREQQPNPRSAEK